MKVNELCQISQKIRGRATNKLCFPNWGVGWRGGSRLAFVERLGGREGLKNAGEGGVLSRRD